MEHRKIKPLVRVLIRYSLSLLTGLVILVSLFVMLFYAVTMNGIVSWANESEYRVAESIARLSETQKWDASLADSHFYQVLVEDSQGNPLVNTLSEEVMKELMAIHQNPQHPRQHFYRAITLEDGTTITYSYTYTMKYMDPKLQEILPPFEPLALVMFLILLGLLFYVLTQQALKKLQRQLQPLNQATQKLIDSDLDVPFGTSTIQEYNQVLSSMEALRLALKQSLEQKWKLQQTQRRQHQALVHDMKTPLTVVQAQTELLLEEKADFDEGQQKALEAILRNVQDIERKLKKLSEAEQQDFVKEEVESAEFLKELRQRAEDVVKSYQQQLLFEADASTLSPILQMAKEEVLRAVLNVVENGCSFSEDGARMKLQVWMEEGRLYLVVLDEGCGFSEEALKQGTQLFFMDESSRTNRQHQGIGLAYCANVVAAHQGSLRLENTADHHGKVTLCLNVQS